MDQIFKGLKSKHSDMENTILRLWAKLIDKGRYDDFSTNSSHNWFCSRTGVQLLLDNTQFVLSALNTVNYFSTARHSH